MTQPSRPRPARTPARPRQTPDSDPQGRQGAGGLGVILSALRDFDAHESLFLHDRVEVVIPVAFYRHAGASQLLDRPWGPVDVRLLYCHRELSFAAALAERTAVPGFTIVERRRCPDECMIEYGVAEAVALSLRDAKRLIIFLQRYFRCFYFNLSTRLSK
jgi:hypothetical protein